MPNKSWLNPAAQLPYQLRSGDFLSALDDLYALLHDMNSALTDKGLSRLEEVLKPQTFTSIISDTLAVYVGHHARVLTPNRYFNGHPDLIPGGQYPNDAVQSGAEGVEVKATVRPTSAADMHSSREGWLCLFRYRVDRVTEPATDRRPTEIVEILLAHLEPDDFRRNERSDRGTRTATPHKGGLAKLRANWLYRDPDLISRRGRSG